MAYLRNTTQFKANAGSGSGGAGSGETFPDAAWSVHTTGVLGEVLVWVKALPTQFRRYRTLQVRIGGTTVSDIPPTTGFHLITSGVVPGSNNVEIRAVMFGNGTDLFYEAVPTLADWTVGKLGGWSSVKAITPIATGNTAVTPATFAAALSGAAAGSRLKLATGNYASLSLFSKVFTGEPLIIDWDGISAKPVIVGMSLTTVQGVYMRNLRITYQPANNANSYDTAFGINPAVKHITYDGCTFECGTVTSGGFYVGRGAGYAFALNPGNEFFYWKNCVVTRFSYFLVSEICDNLGISGCNFTLQTGDTIQINCGRGILIENSTLADWDLPNNDPAHPDAIQLLNIRGAYPCSDFMVRFCKLGGQTTLNSVQGIFGFVDASILASAGSMQRIFMYENHGYLTAVQGIYLSNINRCHIINNTFIKNRLAVGVGSFSYTDTSTGITSTVNDAYQPEIFVGTQPFTFAINNVAVAVTAGNLSANYLIQCNSPNAANGYNTLLKDSNADGVADAMGGAGLIANMVAKAGSALITGGYGAAFART